VDLEQRDREKRVEKILNRADDADLGNFPHFGVYVHAGPEVSVCSTKASPPRC
jgi:hypothetical protein